MLTTEKELVSASIRELIKQTARCRVTITAGSSCLLVVRFERARHLIMDHKTNVGFVDTHAKGVRRDDGFELVVHECVLIPLSIACFHAPVILVDLVVEGFQPIR